MNEKTLATAQSKAYDLQNLLFKLQVVNDQLKVKTELLESGLDAPELIEETKMLKTQYDSYKRLIKDGANDLKQFVDVKFVTDND